MVENFGLAMHNFFEQNIVEYMQELYNYPIKLVSLVIDLAIVIFLITKIIKIVEYSRAWQIMKGIIFLIIATAVSELLNLIILNYILTSIMTYGVIALIVIFQPELRRALEQLGTNSFTRFLGIDKDIASKTKEDIYKIAIAAYELSRNKIGGLIVIERDIKIKDIANTGIIIDADVSPQLLVNLFTPNTPLHDGAVIISNNKIAAAACMLPLANDSDISKELGTRHRAAIGMSKETDSIVVVVSEENVLKKILIKNIITNKINENNENNENDTKMKRISQNMKKILQKKQ